MCIPLEGSGDRIEWEIRLVLCCVVNALQMKGVRVFVVHVQLAAIVG